MKNTNIYRQRFEDPKGVIRKRRSKEDRQYNDPPIARGTAMINILVVVYATKRMKNINSYRQKLEDPKGVIRKRRSKEDRQYNDHPIARGTAIINILVVVYATKRMKNINSYRQKLEDPKGVIRKRRSKEDRQYHDPPIARRTALIKILVEV